MTVPAAVILVDFSNIGHCKPSLWEGAKRRGKPENLPVNEKPGTFGS